MRSHLSIAGACLLFIVTALGVGARAQSIETGVNRPGGDYTSFDLPSADPAACQAACARDSRCRAFTYTVPGFQGPHARCWLKNVVPPPQSSTCCASGVNVAPPPNNGLEEDVARRGSDYRRIDMQTADPFACRQTCVNDQACVAFTYVKPGAAVPGALCFLKNAAPPPTASACCVSGVVRNSPPPPTTGGNYGVPGTLVLTTNCAFTNPAWTAVLALEEAPDGTLSGDVRSDALNSTIVTAGGPDSWGSTVKNQVRGTSFSLVLHPSGWVSVLELTGQFVSALQINGHIHHYTNDDCNFTLKPPVNF